jgi:hypothetical protein
MRLAWVIVLTSILLAGAACSYTSSGRDAIHRGVYTRAYEHNGFHPCGSDEVWWVTNQSDFLGTLYSRVKPPDHLLESYGDDRSYNVYMECQGELSGKGRYGHLGAFPREFKVTRVMEVRPFDQRPQDCR